MASKLKYSTAKHDLNPPDLQRLAVVLSEGLRSYFAEVTVSVVDCPDLRREPFQLAGTGLCGQTCIADIGGVDYLQPLPRLDRPAYSLVGIAKEAGFHQQAFIIGAGAGPFHLTDVNCEAVPNLAFTDAGAKIISKTRLAKVLTDGSCGVIKTKCDQLRLLGNVFISEGLPGKVLKIHVRQRIGAENFTNSIRKILKENFENQAISLGGVFLFKSGTAKLHVMPQFSRTPLKSVDEVNDWLKFYEVTSPLICLSTLHSDDVGLNLRLEHTHCFNGRGDGGHFHYDLTADEAEYEAYFNVAKTIFRVDNPASEQKFEVGNDIDTLSYS